MNKKEKHMYKVRCKVRDLYMSSGIGMEEILEALVKDACCFTQDSGALYEFWVNIERDLKKWREGNNGKSLKIYIAGYGKGISEDEAFISKSVMS